MIIQDLNFCEASVNEIVGGALLAAPFAFSDTGSADFLSVIGAFASTSGTLAGSRFQGTILIDSTIGVVNGVSFTSSFFAGKTVQVATGTTGIII